MPKAAPKHNASSKAKRHSVAVDDQRGSSSQRNYGAAWRKIRDAFLKHVAILQAWPWACCEKCLEEGKRVRATDVDHKTPRAKGGTDDWNNLQALCHSCHSSKTAKEVGWHG